MFLLDLYSFLHNQQIIIKKLFLLSFKKEQITNMQNNMYGFQKHYAKGGKTDTKDCPPDENVYVTF